MSAARVFVGALIFSALTFLTLSAYAQPEPTCTRADNGQPCFGGSSSSSRPSLTPEERWEIQQARRERAEERRKAAAERRKLHAIEKAKKDREKAIKKQDEQARKEREQAAKAEEKRQREEAARQAAAAKRHGLNAEGSGNIENIRDQGSHVFDKPGQRSPSDEVDYRLLQAKTDQRVEQLSRDLASRPVPEALRKTPKYKELEKRLKQDDDKLTKLQRDLDKVEQKRAAATGEEKGKLEVQSANVKQDIYIAKNDKAATMMNMIDTSVKWEQGDDTSKPLSTPPPKPR